jgi:hypothetical protein
MTKNGSFLLESFVKLEKWVEHHHYRGYEPFDALSSPFAALTFNNLFLKRLLTQLIRQNPVNLRPLFLIKKLDSTKGQGYMAWGYLKMFQLTNAPAYKRKAEACLDWLDRHKSPRYENHSWANHFEFAGRGGSYGKNESIIVWTALIGQAYLDAYELLQEKRYLDIALSACRWILSLPREETSSGTCLSYLATWQSSIHNSNMLGAALLARASQYSPDAKTLQEVAKSAMEYSCSRQLSNGAWYYGEDPRYHWFDNFHTGYNLDSLKRYIQSMGDEAFLPHLRKGYTFYIRNFFEPDGRPKYYHNRLYPIDSQCAGQALETLAFFSDDYPESLPLAYKVARWYIQNMQDDKGYFYYRMYPFGIKAKTPMLHWSQATMYKGLSLLIQKMLAPREAS